MKGKPLKRHMIFTLKNTAYKLFLYIGACLLFSLLRAEEIQQRQDEQIYIDTYLKISEIYDKAIQDEDFDKLDSSYKRKIIKELHYVSIKFNLSDIYVSYNFRRPKVSDKVFCTPIVGINYRYNSELNQHIKETSNKKGIDVCSLFTAAICVLDEMYFLHHFINDKEIRNIPSIQTNITQPSFTRLEKNKEVIERRQFYIDYLNSKKGEAQKKVPRGVMASITAKERNVKQSILTVTLKPEYKIFDSIELVRLHKKLHILSQL